MIEFPIHPHEDVELRGDAMVMIQTADILINAGVPPQQRAAEAGTTLLNTSYRRLFVLNKLLCLALHSAGHCSAAVPQ